MSERDHEQEAPERAEILSDDDARRFSEMVTDRLVEELSSTGRSEREREGDDVKQHVLLDPDLDPGVFVNNPALRHLRSVDVELSYSLDVSSPDAEPTVDIRMKSLQGEVSEVKMKRGEVPDTWSYQETPDGQRRHEVKQDLSQPQAMMVLDVVEAVRELNETSENMDRTGEMG